MMLILSLLVAALLAHPMVHDESRGHLRVENPSHEKSTARNQSRRAETRAEIKSAGPNPARKSIGRGSRGERPQAERSC